MLATLMLLLNLMGVEAGVWAVEELRILQLSNNWVAATNSAHSHECNTLSATILIRSSVLISVALWTDRTLRAFSIILFVRDKSCE